jgi:hypothetical protein
MGFAAGLTAGLATGFFATGFFLKQPRLDEGSEGK